MPAHSSAERDYVALGNKANVFRFLCYAFVIILLNNTSGPAVVTLSLRLYDIKLSPRPCTALVFLQDISNGESLEGACHRTDFYAAVAQHLKARLLRRIDLHFKGAYPFGRRLFGWHREQVLARGAHNGELVRSRTLARPPCDGRARLAQWNDARRLVLIRLVQAVKVDEANVAYSEQLGLPSHVAEHAAARATLIDGAVQTRRCTRGTHLAREQSARAGVHTHTHTHSEEEWCVPNVAQMYNVATEVETREVERKNMDSCVRLREEYARWRIKVARKTYKRRRMHAWLMVARHSCMLMHRAKLVAHRLYRWRAAHLHHAFSNWFVLVRRRTCRGCVLRRHLVLCTNNLRRGLMVRAFAHWWGEIGAKTRALGQLRLKHLENASAARMH